MIKLYMQNRSVFFQSSEPLSSTEELFVKKTVDRVLLRYPASLTEEKLEKIAYELSIIIQMGFPDYFLIVQDFLEVGRKIGHMPDDRMNYLREHVQEMSIPEMMAYIEKDQSYPGLTIGPGRGSAAGSAVAYILGITNIDPFEHGLLFERFLNPERVSMPDIDSDFSKSELEYGVRDIVIAYVTKKYGINALCGITTPSTLAARAAVRNIARVIGSRKALEELENLPKTASKKARSETEERIKKQYLGFADSINYKIPKGANVKFSNPCEANGIQYQTLEQYLIEEFSERPELLEIIRMAVRAEGLNINFGMHACGKIIFPGDIRDSAALMLDTKNKIWKIQMDAEQAEEAGYLKMDFLGLINLNLITKAVRLVYEKYGIYIDCDHLPEDPDVYREVFAKARTRSVFQFESAGMRGMLRKFVPEKFSDLVLLVACYRPGPLKYLDGIIARKHGQPPEEGNVIASIPEIRDIVAPTYGAIVYQEQVQQIFRILAGYSLGQADVIRRAMGHKKMDVLDAERKAFLYGDEKRNIIGCARNGVDVVKADKLFDDMMDFAKYAFNKSHAAAYASIAYITAYLKYHYPTEFYTAALCCSMNREKYPPLIQEAKVFGVTVSGPDINHPSVLFTGEDGHIYFGFSGIKGVGKQMNGKQVAFPSVQQFMAETAVTIGDSTVKDLICAGAFDSMTQRTALLRVFPDFVQERDRIRKSRKTLQQLTGMLHEVQAGIPLDRDKWKITTKSLPNEKTLTKRIETASGKIETATQVILHTIIPTGQTFDNREENLKMEKDLLGFYVSGHPLDSYGKPENRGCIPISELTPGRNRKIFGIVSDCRHFLTKKKGEAMCVFTLEDASGIIRVCCFPKAYAMIPNAKNLKDGDVVMLYGNVDMEKQNRNRAAAVSVDSGEPAEIQEDDEEDKENLQFIIGNLPDAVLTQKEKGLICVVSYPGIESYQAYRTMLQQHMVTGEEAGYAVLLYNQTTRMLGSVPFHVSDSVWGDTRLKLTTFPA